MARIYIRIESATKAGQPPTPGDEAAALRVASEIAAALGLEDEAGRSKQRKAATLRGVTLRLDAEG